MRRGQIIMGLLFLAAGAGHFIATQLYVKIVPDYLPAHRELVLISGAAEIAGGLGLMLPATQCMAAWGITALLVAVFPANVWMLQHAARYPSIPVLAMLLRLPLQIPLIWWAYQYTHRKATRSGA